MFSAQRNARQYTQWEVDISQHLALPETLDYFENSLRAEPVCLPVCKLYSTLSVNF